MDKRHIINLQGREFVTYEGLLDEAHKQGLRSVKTTLVQPPSATNEQTAIVTAEIEFASNEGTRVFSGIGDASPRNVSRGILPHLIRMAECVPLQARILSRDGFKLYSELKTGEEVLAYDPDTDRCVWTPLEAIRVYEEPVPTVRLKSRSFEVVCTPDHSWAVKRSGKRVHANPRMLRKTNEFTKSDSIIVAARAEGGTHPLTPEQAALIGWLATDGTVRETFVPYNGRSYGPYVRASIAQSKPHYLDELGALVTATGGTVTVSKPRLRDFGKYVSECLPPYKFNLSTAQVQLLRDIAGLGSWEDLPKLVVRLSQDARAAMLDAMLKGDGSCRRGGSWVFGQKAKPGVTEAFELLATLEGLALGRPRTASRGNVPVRQLRRNRLINTNYLEILRDEAQPVWCPTTRFGTWVMNLDGVISITGNTRAKARAMRDGTNIGMTAFEELEMADLPREEGEGARQAAGKPAEVASLATRAAAKAGGPKLATKTQIEAVAREMKRTGLTPEQGREYLREHFDKISRSELTASEIETFLGHLRGLPAAETA